MGIETSTSGFRLAQLVDNLSLLREIADATGGSTGAAQGEVERQMRQAVESGDPVRGEGVTKSGGEEAGN